jgi:hypothetical protein
MTVLVIQRMTIDDLRRKEVDSLPSKWRWVFLEWKELATER